MANSRTKNSIKNSIISLISFFIIAILQFVNRTVFVNFLSADYLGLNGLFSNIISFLTLADLGIGTAMTYALYKPLKENDTETIKSIMNMYKYLYTLVGVFIIIVGFILVPYLDWFIKDMPKNISHIPWYYCVFVVNAGVSYFLTYKRTIIVCNQNQYISSLTTTLKTIIMSILQIMVLAFTKNYLLYLMVMVLCTIFENISISLIADKQFPYLKEKNIIPLNKSIKRDIQKNISALIFHKIGSMIIFSTDNIIISKYVGLMSVGLYSNYVLITNTLSNAITQIFNSLTASIGNLLAYNDIDHSKIVFDRIFFINYWLYAFCSICLFIMLTPFISLWLGDNYLFNISTTLIIVISFYFTGMRRSVGVFKEAAGLFWNDRYKPLVESVLNLSLSIPLALHFGVLGTILGTIVTTLLLSIPVEAYILFKNYFNESPINYFIKQILYFILTIIIGFITYILINFITGKSLVFFILKLLISIIIPNIFLVAIFIHTKEFKYYVVLIKKIIKKNI